ncbi:DsbA family protein [Erythrobacter sp. Alg231-14]|uniref:DsbA family protein n=1 Tax=Erythrobacter sp. Alg231-14 TaxID=1922225 RepID=UPI000D55D58E
MTASLEFFYDLSSPWTRMAFRNIGPIIEETGTSIEWRPFLVGGVFNAVNEEVYQSRANPDAPKYRHSLTWLKEWSQLAGVAMNFPSEHHPVRSVIAMRACCALEENEDQLLRFSEAAFDGYFRDQRNLDDPAVIAAIANECGLDGEALLAKATEQATKDRLRQSTEEAIARGAFGSPTIFVNRTKLYFGNDQLPLVRQAIEAG